MSEQYLYRFGDFELRPDEGGLRSNGSDIPLTPKMFEMLHVLVRDHGRIVSKEKLLAEVWPDSFVEEGNISYNIRQLRKALGDDAQAPAFIETVPRRGYRFVANVEEVSVSPTSPLGDAAASGPAETPDGTIRSARRPAWQFAAAGIVFAALLAAGVWYFSSGVPGGGPSILTSDFASEKLSTTGNVFTAAISPDGQSIVYSNRQGSKDSLWLRQLASSTNIELIPPSEGIYYDVAFSPDAGQLYYSRGSESGDGKIDIYRVPVRGGIPEKILSGTEGWLSISPDGRKISFVRCGHTEEDYCSLWLADATNLADQKKLISRPSPIRIADNEISPDGLTIAFAVGQSRNQASEFRLMEIPLAGGAEREITSERFFNIKSIAWLPDRSGLLATASRIPNKAFRIWKVANGGTAEPLTKDSGTYSVLSLDRTGSALVATQIEQDFNAYRVDLNGDNDKRLLADASNAAVSPDGMILFSSVRSGNDEIWSMSADGGSQRQLTNDPADDRLPIAASDGKLAYFSSNRSGEAHVWRMRMDGSDQRQVTQTTGGMPMFATPDGRSLFYRHAITGRLWVISLENGEERAVLDRGRSRFGFTSDGSIVAFVEDAGPKPALAAASTADGRNVKTFGLPDGAIDLLQIGWLPGERSFIYIAFQGVGRGNILYKQPFDGGPPIKLRDLGPLDISETAGLGLSPDAKSFVLVEGGWKHDAILFRGLK